jgi:hypothetical protein
MSLYFDTDGGFLLLCSTQMFLLPAWIATTIAATRIHRSLVEYANKSTDMYDVIHCLLFSASPWRCDFSEAENPQNFGLPDPPQTKQINGVSIPMDRIEFAVDIVSERYGTPQAMRDDESCTSTNTEQVYRKPKRLGQNDDHVTYSV